MQIVGGLGVGKGEEEDGEEGEKHVSTKII